MSAQDRETIAAAQARSTAPAADSGTAASIAETAVHPPNHHMEVDGLEKELSGAI